MPNKKKFIDKKNAVTFHLVHRSQRDPLQGSDAPQHVLLPVGTSKASKENRLEEQQKYGIYFDDDYDYMQHLRTVDEIRQVGAGETFSIVPNGKSDSSESKERAVQLPSSVFASNEEAAVGLLDRGMVYGPQPDWDPDIVAALDDDFDVEDPDNLLDDDFIAKANAPLGNNPEEFKEHSEGEDNVSRYFRTLNVEGDFMSNSEGKKKNSQSNKVNKASSDNESNNSASNDEWESDDGSCTDENDEDGEMFADEETKSRFTEYSMSSSVLPRNDGLRNVDDRFEKFYEQYDENEIGALDEEENGTSDKGHNKLLLEDALKEFEKYKNAVTLKEVVQIPESWSESNESSSDNEMLVTEVEEPEKWDCESILSTYSNQYNHPKLIDEPSKVQRIMLTKRAGLPADVLHQKMAKKQIETERRKAQRKEKITQLERKTDETPEERKARKKLIKEDRKNRRQEKKITKLTFKSEQIRQQADLALIQKNVPAVKLA